MFEDLKWEEIHPIHRQAMIDSSVEDLEEGRWKHLKFTLMRFHPPELLDADPRFRPLLEQAREELGHLLTDPELSEPDSPWLRVDLEERHGVWESAIETLEQGNHQLLWQRTLVDYPELIHADPRLKDLWERKPEGKLPELTSWGAREPEGQRSAVHFAVGNIQNGEFEELLERFQECPELIDQDIRLKEVWDFYQKNPPQEGQKPKRMRWMDFSAEGRSLIVERIKKWQNLYTLKDAFKAFPELKKHHPELYQALKEEKEADKQERWNSGDFTWKELGEGLEEVVVETALENLQAGLLDSVEEDLEKYPELRFKDSRFVEIWEAMRDREAPTDKQSYWKQLTEPSRRYVLEAALRQIESAPHGTKLLLRSYPELRALDDRLSGM